MWLLVYQFSPFFISVSHCRWSAITGTHPTALAVYPSVYLSILSPWVSSDQSLHHPLPDAVTLVQPDSGLPPPAIFSSSLPLYQDGSIKSFYRYVRNFREQKFLYLGFKCSCIKLFFLLNEKWVRSDWWGFTRPLYCGKSCHGDGCMHGVWIVQNKSCSFWCYMHFVNWDFMKKH